MYNTAHSQLNETSQEIFESLASNLRYLRVCPVGLSRGDYLPLRKWLSITTYQSPLASGQQEVFRLLLHVLCIQQDTISAYIVFVSLASALLGHSKLIITFPLYAHEYDHTGGRVITYYFIITFPGNKTGSEQGTE